MPVHFALTRQNETTPLPINTVDEEICSAMKVKVSPTEYYLNWYNIIGLKIALGHNFEKIRNNIPKSLIPVSNFIENNYVTHSWR